MKKQSVIISFIILGLVLLYASFYYGKTQGIKIGVKDGEKTFAPIIDLAFPKPPDDIRQLTGTIENIQGATIYLKINSIDDYLPHTDGTPIKTELRYITVTSKTKIVSANSEKLDENGAPMTKNLSFQDLKNGDYIIVRTDKNIRDIQKFDAIYIQVVK